MVMVVVVAGGGGGAGCAAASLVVAGACEVVTGSWLVMGAADSADEVADSLESDSGGAVTREVEVLLDDVLTVVSEAPEEESALCLTPAPHAAIVAVRTKMDRTGSNFRRTYMDSRVPAEVSAPPQADRER